jgi:microsomal epoxide hydrolase
MVTSWLGREHGAGARAIHLNMLGFRPHGGPTSEAEVAWAQKQAAAMDMMGAYFRLQVSKPQSIAWMGAGNPVGQAAWIAERFHDWSDLSVKSLDEAHPKDRLLTNIMLYVMTGSFTSGAWYYRGMIEEGGLALAAGERVETPTAFANFPGEPLYSAPPRAFAERAYNIVRWTDQPRGGHFAAMEEPDLFVADVQAWAREHG